MAVRFVFLVVSRSLLIQFFRDIWGLVLGNIVT